MFVNESDKTITSEIVQAPEPTSVEFEDWFVALLGQALANSDRKLILILDNLDRVDKMDALAIWSTLQVFLQPT